MQRAQEAGPPRVSVILPAFNAEATLGRALDSLSAQTLASFEVIIVDDASTDSTPALAAGIAAADGRFRLLTFTANGGASRARNAGLAEARGTWLLFLDADDWIEPGHLSRLVETAEADATAAGAVGGYRFALPDGRTGQAVAPRLEGDLFGITAQRCPFVIHAAITRRTVVTAAGGFDPGLEVGEDWDLWQRIARAGWHYATSPTMGAVYLLQPASVTHRSSQYLRNCLRIIEQAHQADARVKVPDPGCAAGRPAAELPADRNRFLLVFIGTRLGLGAEAEEAVGLVDPVLAAQSPETIATTIAGGFLQGAACLPEDVPDLWPRRAAQIARTVAQVAEKLGEPALAGALQVGLQRRFLHQLGPDRLPATIGELHAIRLGWRDPLADVPVPPGTTVLRVQLGRGRAFVELPVSGDCVPAATLARAILAVHGGEVLRRFMRESWHRPRTLRQLTRLTFRRGGRDLLGHLAGLKSWKQRRAAMKAFLVGSLPSLSPRLKVARRRDAGPAPVGHEPAGSKWEKLFRDEDPWNYGSSAYEQGKYAHALEALGGSTVGSALELACAEGHFTHQLATRVGDLLATDISATALARAAERCRDQPNVRFLALDLARDPLPGTFDLIVASEVFYYLRNRYELAGIARKIAGVLKPGGLFLTAHSRLTVDEPEARFDWLAGFGAATINAAFAGIRGLEPVREIRTPLYSIALFRKAGAQAAKAKPELIEREAIWPIEPEVLARIRPVGGLTVRDAADRHVTRRLPILMYHRIAADGPDGLATWRVHPERFEAQLDWLKRHGFQSVGLDRWLRAGERRFGELPGRAVCLTFDDGYEDFARTAWPLLRHYGFGATVFLVDRLIGRDALWDAPYGAPAPLMDWPTLIELRRQGVEFGGHTATHPALTRIGPGQLVDELLRSKERLEERLGAEMSSLAFPFGFVDSLVRNAADAAGYRVAVTTRHGYASYGADPLLLPRINVPGEAELDAFAKRLDLREAAPLLRRLSHAWARRRGVAAWSRQG